MKQLLSILLCAALACSLAGCGQKDAASGASSAAAMAESAGSDAAPEEKAASEPSASAAATEAPAASAAKAPAAAPAPESASAPAQAPAAAQAPAPQAAMSTGDIPFSVAEGTDKWFYIDSGDSAYQAVADNINAMRAADGLSALAVDDSLSAAANARCESFVTGGPFDHSGMTTRSEICASGPLTSAGAVCTGWQGSPAHYANIMEPSFTRMGVACWFCVVEGNKFTYWCVTFE